MAQITLYLEESVQTLVEHAAKAQGVSKSRWVAELIRQHAGDQWPKSCLDLAGQFPDFPLCEPAVPPVGDVPRVPW
ncbi:MAG TPA: CopG family transcriptional regulator [Castellaniella sp.]|uniref:CopG family transcriptional regulator n=1 Tax=Castellaniella sp. TaxID=1955812 RepID=UPI002F1B897F